MLESDAWRVAASRKPVRASARTRHIRRPSGRLRRRHGLRHEQPDHASTLRPCVAGVAQARRHLRPTIDGSIMRGVRMGGVALIGWSTTCAESPTPVPDWSFGQFHVRKKPCDQTRAEQKSGREESSTFRNQRTLAGERTEAGASTRRSIAAVGGISCGEFTTRARPRDRSQRRCFRFSGCHVSPRAG